MSDPNKTAGKTAPDVKTKVTLRAGIVGTYREVEPIIDRALAFGSENLRVTADRMGDTRPEAYPAWWVEAEFDSSQLKHIKHIGNEWRQV